MSPVIHSTTIITGDDADSVHHGASNAVRDDRIAVISRMTMLCVRSPPRGDRWTQPHRVLRLRQHPHPSRHDARTCPLRGSLAAEQAALLGWAVAPPLPKLSAEEYAVMCAVGALEVIRSGATAALEDGTTIARCSAQMIDTELRVLPDEHKTLATVHLSRISGEVVAVQTYRGTLPTA